MKLDQPKRLSLLLESDSGVMEILLSVTKAGEHLAFRPLGSMSLSGGLRPADPDAIREALKLAAWCEKNPSVFEGKVTPSKSD